MQSGSSARRTRRAPFSTATLASLLLAAMGAAPPRATASFLCDVLGKAPLFSVVGSARVVGSLARVAGLSGANVGPGMRATCTRSATLANIGVFGDLVALQEKGTAVTFRNVFNDVEGALITGGGGVRRGSDASPTNAIDQSGANPQLATCRQAIQDIATASATLAALAPSQTFGDVFVRKGEVLHIDATSNPLPVLQFDSLVLEGGPGNCMFTEVSGGVLEVDTDLDADLVINTKELRVGNCAFMSTSRTIVNVKGKGGAVKVGAEGFLEGVSLLAPQRSVVVESGSDDPTHVRQLWAQSATLRGDVAISDRPCP